MLSDRTAFYLDKYLNGDITMLKYLHNVLIRIDSCARNGILTKESITEMKNVAKLIKKFNFEIYNEVIKDIEEWYVAQKKTITSSKEKYI